MSLRRDVSNALIARGFCREGRMHLLRVDEDWSYWVDTGPLEARVDIAPFVGIRHDRVEDLNTELLGLPPDDWVGTVGANVGYVLGQGYRRWQPPSPPDDVLSAIGSALEHLKQYLSLEKLADAWEITGSRVPGWHYGQVAVLLLRGEQEIALQRLETARIALCEHDDEICEQFRGFQERVMQRLHADTGCAPQ